MIDEKEIERIALEYMDLNYGYVPLMNVSKESFIAGAKWAIYALRNGEIQMPEKCSGIDKEGANE